MSFIKDVFNDFTRPQEPLTIENIRSHAKGFLFGGIGLMVIFLLYALFYKNEIPLHVQSLSKNVIPNIGFTPDFGSGPPLQVGILNYRPITIIDRILFNSIGTVNLADFLFFLYIGFLFFKNLRKIDDRLIFRLQISKVYLKIATATFWMFGIKYLYDEFFLDILFLYKTNHKFSLVNNPFYLFSIFYYIIFAGIIRSFAWFMEKGEALQQDNDLTI
jgi:hypothetical protein